MGRVYLAFTPAGHAVALKVVRPDLGSDLDFRHRFRQEVEAARRVHGLYTAQVLDADPDAAPPWLVTAYVPGPSLQEAVAEHGPMPEQTVFVLLAGVAEALAAIHAAGVVHRDLKPSNVLLAPDGPRVIDFGIARAVDATMLTRTGMRLGSPHFMAPEQVAGVGASPAIDVFALGALGVFAAVGRPPFGDGDEMTLLYRVVHTEPDLSGCPRRLHEILVRCLAKDPAGRPSLAEIIAACREQTAQAGRLWLPPAVAATLTQHIPPHPLGAADHLATGTVALAAGDFPAAAPAVAAGPSRDRRGRGWMMAGGGLAAVGLAALGVAGFITLGSRHGAHSAVPPTLNAAVTQTPARPSPKTPTPKASKPKASKSASRQLAVDACLVGTWINTADNPLVKINNIQVDLTGHGGYVTVRANGSGVWAFGPETASATVNGNYWTFVLQGSATMHVTTLGGAMYFSNVADSKNATWTYYENGVYNSSGPEALGPGPLRYTCSGNTLRTFTTTESSVFARKPAR